MLTADPISFLNWLLLILSIAAFLLKTVAFVKEGVTSFLEKRPPKFRRV